MEIAGAVWLYYGEGYNYIHYELYFVAALLGAGSSILLVTGLGIVNDLIGHNTVS